MITAIGVVVPARNEEALIGRCLRSIATAAAIVTREGIEAVCVVVLDSCSDDSRAVTEAALEEHAASAIVEIDAANVGSARGVGIACLLERLHHHALGKTWIATTDADTCVPPSWLADQIRHADRGADAVAGTIEVTDWSEQPESVRTRFAARYTVRADGSHDHVHGANLGLRASTYVAAGGMPSIQLAEDHALLEALAGTGAVIARTSSVRVTTSARRSGRAAGGFSDLLASLDTDRQPTTRKRGD